MSNILKSFKAAAIQDCPVWLQLAPSVNHACDLIHEAGENGADIVAFPESFLPGFPYWVFNTALSDTASFHRRLYDNAVDIPGPVTQQLGEAAKNAGVVLVMGVTERDTDTVGTLYNTNLVFNSDGTLLGKHRKTMPTWGERAVWRGGDSDMLDVFSTEYGTLGTLCCGENLNTLARFALLAQGERVHVANFPSAVLAGARHSVNELYLHCAPHAYEGKLYSIVASDFGTKEVADELGIPYHEGDDTSYNCISGIFGPNGEWVGEPLKNKRGIVYADCPVDPVIGGKLFHDITGHYNRFDLLQLKLNKKPQKPLLIVEE